MPHYRTMTDLATESLRERLLAGGFEPGTRLIPSELEESLNLGRMAIREALRELTGTGLVIQRANKGICVAPPPAVEELEALFGARCAMEGQTAAQAAANMDKATLEKLEEYYQEMEVTSRPAIEYFLINRKFHLTLYGASGWRHAVVCIAHMLDQVLSYFGPRAAVTGLDFVAFNREHRFILDAIYDGDAARVSELIVDNINRGRRLMSSLS